MQFNNRTILSILILQELEYAEDALPRRELARRLKVSPDCVGQMLAVLRRAGYIKSFASDTTGCRRVKSAEEIPLTEFLQKLEGLPPDHLDDPADMRMVREKARGLIKGTVADCFTKKASPRPHKKQPDMLTAQQVSQMLGVRRPYVYAMVTAGLLAPPQIVNGVRRWPKEAVDKVMQRRQITPKGQRPHTGTACKACGRYVIPYLLGLQVLRLRVRHYPEDIIEKTMPRCPVCTTEWMQEHQDLRQPR